MFKSLPLAALFLVASASAADTPSPYEPLAFLSGHCWKGELPGGRGIDTHCFTYIYGQKFVRDTHTVRADSHPDYLGESIYFWDGKSKKLKYLYVESDGGSSEGVVDSADDALIFPATDYQQDGKTQTYRSRWKKSGADAYDVLTEFKKGDAWTLGWKVHMTQIAK
jgi:hypothetical protein